MRFYFSGERINPQLLDELGYFVDDFQRFCRQKLDRKNKTIRLNIYAKCEKSVQIVHYKAQISQKRFTEVLVFR